MVGKRRKGYEGKKGGFMWGPLEMQEPGQRKNCMGQLPEAIQVYQLPIRELIGTLSGQEWMPLLRTDCDGKATTSTRNGPRAMRHGFQSTQIGSKDRTSALLLSDQSLPTLLK